MKSLAGQVATDRGITVALDVTLTDELRQEGIARELINRIQNARKNADFDVTDRIIVQVSRQEQVDAALEQFADYVANEVLADRVVSVDDLKGEPTEITEGIEVVVNIDKVS